MGREGHCYIPAPRASGELAVTQDSGSCVRRTWGSTPRPPSATCPSASAANVGRRFRDNALAGLDPVEEPRYSPPAQRRGGLAISAWPVRVAPELGSPRIDPSRTRGQTWSGTFLERGLSSIGVPDAGVLVEHDTVRRNASSLMEVAVHESQGCHRRRGPRSGPEALVERVEGPSSASSAHGRQLTTKASPRGSGSPVGKTGGEGSSIRSIPSHSRTRSGPSSGAAPRVRSVVLAGDVAAHGSRRRLRGKQRRDERRVVGADQRDDAALVREKVRNGLAPHVALGGW